MFLRKRGQNYFCRKGNSGVNVLFCVIFSLIFINPGFCDDLVYLSEDADFSPGAGRDYCIQSLKMFC